jgi:hypothetical protein
MVLFLRRTILIGIPPDSAPSRHSVEIQSVLIHPLFNGISQVAENAVRRICLHLISVPLCKHGRDEPSS